MAGVEGFEPPHDGTRTRCLTTWRHPIAVDTVAQAEVVFKLFAPELIGFHLKNIVISSKQIDLLTWVHEMNQPIEIFIFHCAGKNAKRGYSYKNFSGATNPDIKHTIYER